MKKRNFAREILFYAVILALIIGALSVMFRNNSATNELQYYSEISEKINGSFKQNETDPDPTVRVTEIQISNDNLLTMICKETSGEGDQKTETEKVYTYQLADVGWFRQNFDEVLIAHASEIKYEIEPATTLPWWVSLLPTLLIVILFIVVYIVSFSKMGGGTVGKISSFGKAKTKTPTNDKNKVLFRDVAGADEEKEELVEIVEFLKDPVKFTKLGARIPHGVLLVGPPGTGKTLLAKAVAGEAGVPFFSISGSDFVEMYVGVGASRVRDLFDNARKTPAAIIFIDEIDAVGRHRGAGLGGGHDEREQTLNQLLVEMDGFGSHDGIIVMAATNRPDILDPALLRPGRFDRQVTVNYPDMRGREAILKVHARNKPLEESVDFHKIAQTTVGFTGADLANLLNEAALLAAKKGKNLIGMDDIEASFMKSLLGPQKKSKVRTEKENRLTAFHEAGHAVVSYYCKNTDPVKYITIIPAGRTGGVTVSVPEEDTSYTTRGSMLDHICMSLGGRIAEELVMDDISTGASADIQQATKVARNMVTRYGMSERLGAVLYGSEHSSDEVFLGRDYGTGKDYSEQTAAAIDEEIQRLVTEAYARAKAILTEHLDRLKFVAEYLLAHESMDGDQFAAAMKDDATVEELDAIAEAKAEQSRRDNEERAARDEEKENEEDHPEEGDPDRGSDPFGGDGDDDGILRNPDSDDEP